MSRTTQRSPSIAVLSPEEGAVLSEAVSVKSAQFSLDSRTCQPEDSRIDVPSAALISAMVIFPQDVLLVDVISILHPFSTHWLDAGPIRLTTIAHAFNYRMAVLRDVVKSAAHVGRSRRVKGRFLDDTAIPWGHQVAVMFQIVSALALEMPTFLHTMEKLRGVSPDVQLSCEPWGHADHNGGSCECLSSDRTGAFVCSQSISHTLGEFI